jgi:hypothetical protein
MKPKKQICNEKLRQKSNGKPEVTGRAFEISYLLLILLFGTTVPT